MSFQNLPEEILFYLSKFLNGRDLVRFSHVCQRFFYICQNDHLWLNILERENIQKDSDIVHFAKTQLTSLSNKEKLYFIHHSRTGLNWKKCNFSTHNLPLSDKSKVGNDSRTLVKITTVRSNNKKKYLITVFDLRFPGFHPLALDHHLDIELKAEHEIFNLDLQAILVARSTAVLCFNGTGDDTPQEIIAIDLETFQELWRDVIHDWGQFQLMRLFGREVYKFDLLSNTIEVHDIRNYDKLSSLTLVEEMRYPHGEIAGDGRHLAIPGKMSEDNSPAVCVWNVRRRTRKFLYPTSAFCPFRWFEKVAVSKGKVFGLLNRRCLFAWEAESALALFKINLTESYPGQQEPSLNFTFLRVFNNYFATINQDPGCQVVYKVTKDSHEKVLDLDWLKKSLKTELKICDVLMNDQCVITQMFNLKSQRFEAVITHFEENEEDEVKNIPLESTGPIIPGQLNITPSKLLNLTPQQVYMYDFLL